MSGKRITFLTVFGAIILVLSLLVGAIPGISAEESRTGTNTNQPATGFEEGTEKIEIYHPDTTHDTTFAIDETMNLRITSNVVDSIGGNVNDNIVKFFDNASIQIGNDHTSFFSPVGGGPPYVYEGSVDLTGANGFVADDDYLMEVSLRKGGPNQVVFKELIHVGASTAPNEKHIKIFEDDSYTTERYDVSPTGTLYMEVWSGDMVPDATQSVVKFSDYLGNSMNPKKISDLTVATITEVGNHSRFSFDLGSDFTIGSIDLLDGYWFTMQVSLLDSAGGWIILDWPCQFVINTSLTNPPQVIQGATKAIPGVIEVGKDTTTISTEFTHSDSPSPDMFTVTLKVKDESGAEKILVEQNKNGFGGLTITQDGGDPTKYNASFDWTPGVAQELGFYDLYFNVTDGITDAAEDQFVNNEDELELVPPPGLPIIAPGATIADPDSIKVEGNQATEISVNFSHVDQPAADSFFVTFKVRDPGNHQKTLVDREQSGNAGLTVVGNGDGTYVANFTWDPDPGVDPVGKYDLFSRVEDGNGAVAEDPFPQNLNELELTKAANVPTIQPGAITATPAKINRTGSEFTRIAVTFSHDDGPGIASFLVSFKVRDEDNVSSDLVLKQKTGFGGLVITDEGSNNYEASYNWDPLADQKLGFYDLYCEIIDGNNISASDGFDNNPNEVEVIKKPGKPVLTAGATDASPASIFVNGTDSTTITVSWSHEDSPEVGVFKVTFLVRDAGNNPTTIIQSGTSGSGGLFISKQSDTEYVASIDWDPPETQALGTYDLYSSIVDGNGNKVEDPYSNNGDVLTLKKGAGPGTTEIVGKVVDATSGTAIANVSVTVYKEGTTEVVGTGTTDSTGGYSIKDVPPGMYDLEFSAVGYNPKKILGVQTITGTKTVDDVPLTKTGGGPGPGDGGEGEIPGWIYTVIGLLILIIIVLFVLILMKSGKSEEKESKHEPHMVDKDDVKPDHPIESKEKKEIDDEPKPIPSDEIEVERIEDED
jgi:hypothetical protein